MKLENIKHKEDNILLYQTEDFATIRISFLFSLPDNTKKTIIKTKLLSKYLTRTNKYYKKYKTIRNKRKELYDMDIDICHATIGKQSFLSVTIDMVDPNLIQDNYFKDAISLAHKILFNPNFSNNHLNKEVFEEIKKDLVNIENINISKPNIISKRLMFVNMIPDSTLAKNRFIDIEEFKEITNSIKEEELIQFYKEIIENNFYKGYVFGNITDNDYKIIEKAFPFKSKNLKPDFIEKSIIQKDYKEIINENLKQSYLYVVYDIKNYTKGNAYLYDTLMYMLNGAPGLCHKVLRTELGIVYNAFSDIYRNRGFLYIKAEISKENKDKCLNGIDEIMNRMTNHETVQKLLKFAKEFQNQEYYSNEEIFNANINELENYVYEEGKSTKEKIKLINKLTEKDIINQINNLEKKYIFFYKGDK